MRDVQGIHPGLGVQQPDGTIRTHEQWSNQQGVELPQVLCTGLATKLHVNLSISLTFVSLRPFAAALQPRRIAVRYVVVSADVMPGNLEATAFSMVS